MSDELQPPDEQQLPLPGPQRRSASDDSPREEQRRPAPDGGESGTRGEPAARETPGNVETLDTAMPTKSAEAEVPEADEVAAVDGPVASDQVDDAEPGHAEPDVAEPDVAEPDVAEPDVAEPDVAEPDAEEFPVQPSEEAEEELPDEPEPASDYPTAVVGEEADRGTGVDDGSSAPRGDIAAAPADRSVGLEDLDEDGFDEDARPADSPGEAEIDEDGFAGDELVGTGLGGRQHPDEPVLAPPEAEDLSIGGDSSIGEDLPPARFTPPTARHGGDDGYGEQGGDDGDDRHGVTGAWTDSIIRPSLSRVPAQASHASVTRPDASAAGPDADAATLSPRMRLLVAMRPRATRAQLLAMLLCFVLGLAGFLAVRQNQSLGLDSMRQSDLVSLLDNVTEKSTRLEDETRRLQAMADQLKSGSDKSAAALDAAQQRLELLGILAGTSPAVGPGIKLTVTDPKGQVTAATLLDTVQELRDAGAEAIQIGNVRVVASTSFVDGVGGVRVDGTQVPQPYVFLVIGDSQTLSSALGIPGGVLEVLKQQSATGTVESRSSVTVSALRPVSAPQYARPATSATP